jgi:hypothetical protein
MAWGSKVTATQVTAITNTRQYFDTNITLNPGEIVQCQVSGTYGGTTDDLTVHVESTLDDSSESWDTVDYLSFAMTSGSAAGTSDIRSFLVSGVYKFRVGVESTGATDTHPTASFSYRKDGVNA